MVRNPALLLKFRPDYVQVSRIDLLVLCTATTAKETEIWLLGSNLYGGGQSYQVVALTLPKELSEGGSVGEDP